MFQAVQMLAHRSTVKTIGRLPRLAILQHPKIDYSDPAAEFQTYASVGDPTRGYRETPPSLNIHHQTNSGSTTWYRCCVRRSFGSQH